MKFREIASAVIATHIRLNSRLAMTVMQQAMPLAGRHLGGGKY
jgi:hypothetical protein